jgi:hypothetical protein
MEMKMAIVSVIKSEIYEDGGYSALVRAFGREISINYINGEIRTYGGASQYEKINWKVDGAIKAAKEFAAWQISLQPKAWHAAHKNLYA